MNPFSSAASKLKKMLAPAPAPAPAANDERPGAEMAWGGSRITSGIVSEDHLVELRGRQGMETATKMRRTDAQVRSVEKAISLPIRGTVWMVNPPDNASAAEKEAAELLQENLFG